MSSLPFADQHGVLGTASRNALLQGLSSAKYDRLTQQFEQVPLRVKQILHTPDMPIEHLYFPRSGVLSLLAMDNSAQAVEVGSIGNEGMAGLAVFHGMHSAGIRRSALEKMSLSVRFWTNTR